MFSRAIGAAVRSVYMQPVIVEADVSNGLPVFDMVGLLNSEVKEAKERVRTAIRNTGIQLPPKRITVNLSPAELRKAGGSFDLPIAVGILQAAGFITSIYNIEETVFVGELGLDGRIRGVHGILAIALSAKEQGYRKIVIPDENSEEASVVTGIEIVRAGSLREMVSVLNGDSPARMTSLSDMAHGIADASANIQDVSEGEGVRTKRRSDFSEINGQEPLKRAALVAAAGRHNILFVGPPGSGKTMVASRLAGILPRPDMDECIEITRIYSIAGELQSDGLIKDRPFRSPHHTITPSAMAGGGMNVKPGEISLAHRGVLFLDELAEYKRETLEVLRQPLESRKVVINRASGSYVFPADIMLAAATNPCRCGYYPDRSRCRCTEYEVRKYIGRISGPLLSRIDITIASSYMTVGELQGISTHNVTSEELRRRVEAAGIIQRERYEHTGIRFNAELEPQDIKKYCYLGEKEKRILRRAFDTLGVSARAYYRTIRVARTIADLDGALRIEEKHIAEAVGYRQTSL